MSDNTSVDERALERLVRLGGAKLACAMIDLFVQHVPLRLEVAQAGAESGDLRTVHAALHSIITSAAYLGAVELAELAKTGTQRAASDDARGMTALLEQMVRTYHEVDAILRRKRIEYQT